ncbi:hypothetical protein [Poseidonibacter ostreae]|uniref:Uncharacterized protein n=1 Tax=Poseidonibacter ostreae TaxID=2654171 RepID=A0A6L4WW48_9BACT|nr:hypothetical protein [Poseidonibacter ostreae]KAB7891292.1 hypothetical protein GBG19_00215 [Poseidonibacter ostreae]
MKLKRIIFLSSLIGATTFLLASEKSFDASGMLDLYYKKGLKAGASEGYQRGFEQGLELAKKRIRLYAQKIKANENGKYLKEYGGKITNPEIYQIRDGSNISVIVKGCKIEKQLTPDEIIDLELYPMDGDNKKFKYYNVDKNNTSLFDEQNPTVSNSADIFSNDNMGYKKSRPSVNNDKSDYIYLPNSSNLRAKLTNLNYSFAIENDRIKVIYGSIREKDLLLKSLNSSIQ